MLRVRAVLASVEKVVVEPQQVVVATGPDLVADLPEDAPKLLVPLGALGSPTLCQQLQKARLPSDETAQYSAM